MAELNDPDASVGSADVTFDAAGDLVIKLGGDVDLSNVEMLRAAIDAAVSNVPERVVFDLSTLDFMDSSGIALLLQTAAAATSVRVLQPSPIVRRVIEATGLSDILRVEP